MKSGCLISFVFTLAFTFGCLLGIMEDVSGQDSLEVGFEIFPDCTDPYFPDPIFAMIRLRNEAGRPALMPTFAQHSCYAKIRLVAGKESIDHSFRPNYSSGNASYKPLNYLAVQTFVFRYSSSEMIRAINAYEEVKVEASMMIRPETIDDPKMVEYFANNNRLEDGYPMGPTYYSEGNDILSVEDSVSFSIDPAKSIFKDPKRFPAVLARTAAAWLPREQENNLTREIYQIVGSSGPPRQEINFSAIESIPILKLFPEQVETIQPQIRPDTATWRMLEAHRFGRLMLVDPIAPAQARRIADAAIELLKTAGPAELFDLEVRCAGSILAALVQKEDMYDRRRINYSDGEGFVSFNQYWAEQLAKHFPGVPLNGLWRHPEYGDDGYYPHLQADRIEIDYVQDMMKSFQAAAISGD